MTLTVPTAGSIGGRSASIQVATPDTGAVLSEFGNALAAKAGQWKQEQLGRQARQTQLDITRDLGIARQEIEANVADPAQIGPTWEARVAEIRARHITPEMDPTLAEDLGQTFQALGDRHSLELGNRVIGLTQSQREAEWVETRARISAEAVNADPTTFQAYVELGEAAIDERLARAIITPEQAATEKVALRQEVFGARADLLIGRDPAAFLDAAQGGEWNMLGDGLASRQKAAERAVAEAQARAEKDAVTAAQARSDDIGKRLGEMTNIFALGRRPVDEAFLADPEVQAHPKYAEAVAARSLRDESPGLKTMTVTELDRLIAAEASKPIAAEYQNERLKVLRTWRDEAAAKQATDTVGWAVGAGLAVPELPPFDPADPQGFVAGLSQRLSFDRTMQAQGYTRGTAVFSADELRDAQAAIDPKADAETRLGMARAFTALGDDAARYLTGSVLKADPAFVRATELMSLTGSDQVAQEILRGQQRIESKTVNMPTQPQLVATFDEVTGGAFDDNIALKTRLIEAAKAVYADGAAGIDPDGTDSAVPFMDDTAAVEAFGTAVQRVLGGAEDRNGEFSIGGLQEVNGKPVLLPPGVARVQVEDALEAVRDQLDGAWTLETLPPEVRNAPTSGMVRVLPDPGPMPEDQKFALLRAASLNGAIPDLGPDPATRLNDVALRPVFGRNGRQTDAYELVYMQNGVPVKVRQKDDPDGKPYRFSLSDLIREASRGD